MLLHDSVGRDSRFLLFGRTSAIAPMSRSRIWYIDETFKSRPLLFAQLYVLHYQYQGHVIPGMFVLMERKTEQPYLDVFRTVQQQMPDDHRQGPDDFSVDFELGSANAFKNVFADATEDFCFFNFCQSMWRRLQSSGHVAEYMLEENTEIRMQFHAILSICFVPTLDVPEVFGVLSESCVEELDEVIDHLEVYYIFGRRRGRGRQRPRCPIDKRNVYERVLDGLPRTNNTCEA